MTLGYFADNIHLLALHYILSTMNIFKIYLIHCVTLLYKRLIHIYFKKIFTVNNSLTNNKNITSGIYNRKFSELFLFLNPLEQSNRRNGSETF